MGEVVGFAKRHGRRGRWALSHLDFMETAADRLTECLQNMPDDEFDAEFAALNIRLVARGATPPAELVLAIYEREAGMRAAAKRPPGGSAA